MVMLVSALGGVWHYRSGLSLQTTPAKSQVLGLTSTTISPSPAVTTPQTTPAPATSNLKPTPSSQKSGVVTSGPVAPAIGASSPTTVHVSLSVGGTYKGTVPLASTSNHCDVLAQALKVGIINGLDMRYDTVYGTYGVYVINGIGDPGTVWWTYKVNGKSPPVGCSLLQVHDGDSVNWHYIKS